VKNESLRAVVAEIEAANVPYRIVRARKHIHVQFGPDFGQSQTVPCTGGDRRGPRNARADVRRALRNLEAAQ